VINQLVSQRYEILEKVGEGPLFTVFKARDTAMNRVVAVKVLAQQYRSDESLCANLKSALEETITLNHTGITRYYEYREEGPLAYFVCEFVRGIDLKERIRRIAPFTLSLAVDFGCSMADALHYAHSVGQVHGDLRPHNIVISPEGVLKITNFGVQKATSRSPDAQVATLKLAAPYHSPELSTTSPGTVAGDIYAAGAVLYEMLTGSSVYTGASAEDQSDQHAFAPVPSARVINPGVPRSVDGIIVRCLQKRPEERYRSMSELLNDLKSVRDALRFGKPLSWSPVDTPAVVTPVAAAKLPPTRTQDVPAPMPAAVAAGYERNRLRVQDDRVSVYIKFAIGTVTSLILACAIWVYGIYLAHWIVPPAAAVPQLVGKPIEDVRKLAADRKFHLNEHPEYNDKPRGIVYQTDVEPNAKLRALHSINVWYSRGPEYVNVPNVVNLPREQAEQKLKDAGLKVGRVTPEYNDTVPENVVLSQDVTYKKRVFHDQVVSLSVSNGPNPNIVTPAESTGTTETDSTDTNTTDNTQTTGENGAEPAAANSQADDSQDTTTHTFSRYISILKDGKGRRQVRVEFTDAAGSHPPVIDEGHEEGDKILIKFDYTGKMITLRVLYDSRVKMERTFDPEATKRSTIR
jgi:serine/threonine-protein kinase